MTEIKKQPQEEDPEFEAWIDAKNKQEHIPTWAETVKELEIDDTALPE